MFINYFTVKITVSLLMHKLLNLMFNLSEYLRYRQTENVQLAVYCFDGVFDPDGSAAVS